MNYNLPEAGKDSPMLNIVEGPENAPANDVQVNLDEERQQLKEQADAEEFWAGRNLAGRKSTRRAA